MSTKNEIESLLSGMITGINNITGAQSSNLTEGVNALIGGYWDGERIDLEKLYEALQYSGLITEDMTYEEICAALEAFFPESTPYHVVFTEYPLVKTDSGIDAGTASVSTAETGYTLSVKKDPGAGGHGYVEGSVTLPTKGCNKVEISYTYNGAADVKINDTSVINKNTYTIDCTEDTCTLKFKVSEATASYTATLQIKDIYFYRDAEPGGGSGGSVEELPNAEEVAF